MDKFEDFLVNKGLYDPMDISVDDLGGMQKYLYNKGNMNNNIDCYCVSCETNRVFVNFNCLIQEGPRVFTKSMVDDETDQGGKSTQDGVYRNILNKRFSLTYRCAKEKSHTVIFDLITTDKQVMKVGQYPSYADMVIPEIKKYRTILDKQYREFSRAIGLFANGIGVGSFVYLRRIIEGLVFDKFSEVSKDLEISADDFSKRRFDEKIDMLSDYLPDLLVSKKNLYGIVGKGVHELSEEECLAMFPIIRTGIELILDDILNETEKAKKVKKVEKFIADPTGKLK